MNCTRIFAALFALMPLAAQAVPIQWVDWQTSVVDASGFTGTGQIVSGDKTVTVTYNNPRGVGFYQSGAVGEVDWWAQTVPGVGRVRDESSSPYTSTGPNGIDNIPTGTDMIALRFAGSQTLTFSEAIGNPVFAFISLNANGYGFDRDFDLLSSGSMNIDGNGQDDCGWWGCGTSAKDISGDGTVFSLIGTGEPHGALRFSGAFNSLTWNSLTDEFWNGFTIGVEGTADQVFPDPDLTPVPLPASFLMLAAGLLGIGSVLGSNRWCRSRGPACTNETS